MWIFGYGSLIFRPGFPHLARERATLRGYARRFYQGSPDHRGTEDAPGRVVTLVEDARAQTVGVVFQIDDAQQEEVLARLDVREQGGYVRRDLTLVLDDGRELDALVFYAGPDNAHYLGPASVDEMAAHIAGSVGPSGANVEYLLKLKDALDALDAPCPHINAIVGALRATAGE